MSFSNLRLLSYIKNCAKKSNALITLLFVVVLHGSVFGQFDQKASPFTPFTVHGKFFIEDSSYEGSYITLEKNGTISEILYSTDTIFCFDLDYQNEYILSFNKIGHISKAISINTKVPQSILEEYETFDPFLFHVTLQKQPDGDSIKSYNNPVGGIRYEPSKEEFDYHSPNYEYSLVPKH